MEKENRKCPKCGSTKNQMNSGFTVSGSQRCLCWHCKCKYTPKPKPWVYPEAIRRMAIKEYFSGTSAMGVGKIHGFSKANVLNWIKRGENAVDK